MWEAQAQESASLRLLAAQYPNRRAVLAEIINLQAILHLPKGTEHFMSDLHGEYDAFLHIMNNCSGVIREKISLLFSLSPQEEAALCTLIYYPKEKLVQLHRTGGISSGWYLDTLYKLIELARFLSSKYTRSKVRKALPGEYAYILDELLHAQKDEDDNRQLYHTAILESIVENNTADDFICALCALLKRLAVDHLHIVGDLFDRGAHPDKILDILMQYHSLDLVWGNHDILWMGAASGSLPCIANVVRNCVRYHNCAVLENGYGIPLRRLAMQARTWYPELDEAQAMEEAITVLLFKLEGQCIAAYPEYGMADRLLLDKMDAEHHVLHRNGTTAALGDHRFPTLDPADPYRLAPEEQQILDDLQTSFAASERLQRHVDFLFQKGHLYLVYNGNLLFHGCIPLDENGNFSTVVLAGVPCQGRALFDRAEQLVRQARQERTPELLDILWYLWCGKNSPLSGRETKTFERCYCTDRTLWQEPRNAYYTFCNDKTTCTMILHEFGLYGPGHHIINGHTPIHANQGESPIKAGGMLVVIDGGFCRAMQSQTGIAGYTLIYNSHGMRIKAHRPFSGTVSVLEQNFDIESDSVCFGQERSRLMVADTDNGQTLNDTVKELKKLLRLYQEGRLKEH